jgi:hypothetical protein
MVLVSYWMDSYLLHISIHGTRKKVVMFIHFLHSLGTTKQYCTLVSSTSLKDLARRRIVGRCQNMVSNHFALLSGWNKHCLFFFFFFLPYTTFFLYMRVLIHQEFHWILNNGIQMSNKNDFGATGSGETSSGKN